MLDHSSGTRRRRVRTALTFILVIASSAVGCTSAKPPADPATPPPSSSAGTGATRGGELSELSVKVIARVPVPQAQEIHDLRITGDRVAFTAVPAGPKGHEDPHVLAAVDWRTGKYQLLATSRYPQGTIIRN